MDKEDRQEIQRIKQIISEKLKHGFIFMRAVSLREEEELPSPSINFDDRERRDEITKIKAVLRVAFRLSQIRHWLALDENDESRDKLILEALDAVAKAGKAKFLSITQIHDCRYDELLFQVESGIGWSSFAPTDNKSEVTRLYVDTPLRKAERESLTPRGGILEVKEYVEHIWAESRRKLELRYGIPTDTDIEKKLWRDELDAKTAIGLAQLNIAGALEEKKSKDV